MALVDVVVSALGWAVRASADDRTAVEDARLSGMARHHSVWLALAVVRRMTCETCPELLTPAERRAGKRRCRTCCQAMPRILAARPVRKGHAHISAEWQRPVGKFAKEKAKPSVSWWTSWATGPRRDAEYIAETARRHPETGRAV